MAFSLVISSSGSASPTSSGRDSASTVSSSRSFLQRNVAGLLLDRLTSAVSELPRSGSAAPEENRYIQRTAKEISALIMDKEFFTPESEEEISCEVVKEKFSKLNSSFHTAVCDGIFVRIYSISATYIALNDLVKTAQAKSLLPKA